MNKYKYVKYLSTLMSSRGLKQQNMTHTRDLKTWKQVFFLAKTLLIKGLGKVKRW